MKFRAPVLLAVGVEGVWGLALCTLALPALEHLRGADGRPLDSFTAAVAVRGGAWCCQRDMMRGGRGEVGSLWPGSRESRLPVTCDDPPLSPTAHLAAACPPHLQEVRADFVLQWTTALSVVTIALFNFCGVR